MRFDFASRRTTGGLSTLELKGTDQLKKGSSWPGSGVETMSTMPGETRVVINWSSQFIDKTRVCPARRPSRLAFGVRARARTFCLLKRRVNPIRSAFPKLHPGAAGLELLTGRWCLRPLTHALPN
jgi:hypothetical protein